MHIARHTTIGTHSLIERHQMAIQDLICQGDNLYGAVHGSGERVVHLRFPNHFCFISRDWSTIFCKGVGMISIKPFHEGEIIHADPRDALQYGHRVMVMRSVMS